MDRREGFAEMPAPLPLAGPGILHLLCHCFEPPFPPQKLGIRKLFYFPLGVSASIK